jgi:hypothetical protein
MASKQSLVAPPGSYVVSSSDESADHGTFHLKGKDGGDALYVLLRRPNSAQLQYCGEVPKKPPHVFSLYCEKTPDSTGRTLAWLFTAPISQAGQLLSTVSYGDADAMQQVPTTQQPTPLGLAAYSPFNSQVNPVAHMTDIASLLTDARILPPDNND